MSELLLDALLADELVERPRAERAIELVLAPACSAGARNCSVTPPSAPGGRAPRAEPPDRCRPAPAPPRRASSRARRARRAPRDRARPSGTTCSSAELLLQLEHDALRGLLPDSGNRQEARGVAEDDRAPQLRRRASPRRSSSATFGPTPGHGQELLEELPLGRLGEPVELEDVLAHVEIRVERDLAPVLRLAAARARTSRQRGSPTPLTSSTSPSAVRATGVPVRRAITPRLPSATAAPARGRSRPRARRLHGSASGGASRRRIACTMRCTWAFSARP